jgi:hypothetical protein
VRGRSGWIGCGGSGAAITINDRNSPETANDFSWLQSRTASAARSHTSSVGRLYSPSGRHMSFRGRPSLFYGDSPALRCGFRTDQMHGGAIAVQLVGRFGLLTVIKSVMTAASIGASRGGGYARYLEGKTVVPERGDYYLTPDGEMVQAPGRWLSDPETLSRLGIHAGVPVDGADSSR